MRFDSVLDSIGHTPLVRLRGASGHGADLFGKLELMNPYGLKDRYARHAVCQAKASGELKDGDILVESSSGTLAVGLAMVGRALGHEVHIVTDPRIDPITLAKLRALDAVVYIVEQMDEHGWQGARLAKLRRVMDEHPGAFWLRQYTNADNPASYVGLAQELLDDIGRVDVLVGPVGSGGSLCGTARALKAAEPSLTVIAVDAVGSVIFDQPDRPSRLQSGLGNSLVPPNVDRGVIDEVHWLSDGEAFAATLRLARDEQIFAGNSSGSAYWVARWASAQLPTGTIVVVILPDRGDRYAHTVYDPAFRAAHNLVCDRLPDVPARVPEGTVVASWSSVWLTSQEQAHAQL
jgi:S-sulfo-L-cysteine synthase (3-phospho-L-serine-dependent)